MKSIKNIDEVRHPDKNIKQRRGCQISVSISLPYRCLKGSPGNVYYCLIFHKSISLFLIDAVLLNKAYQVFRCIYKLHNGILKASSSGCLRRTKAAKFTGRSCSKLIKNTSRYLYPSRARCTKCCTFGPSPPLPRNSAGT